MTFGDKRRPAGAGKGGPGNRETMSLLLIGGGGEAQARGQGSLLHGIKGAELCPSGELFLTRIQSLAFSR
jgi:hypothetical protein